MKREDLIIITLLTGFVIFIAVGCFLDSHLVYDNFIWRYYWGPVVSDALNHPAEYHGIIANEGYTLVSEITYGIITLLALYYIYRLFRRLKITIDWGFCISLIPLILFGPFSRVLEDTGYFEIPLVYWFISPLIYMQIAVYTLIFIVIGWYVEREKNSFPPLAIAFGGASLFCFYIWSFSGMVKEPINPVIVFVCIVYAILPIMFDFYRNKEIRRNSIVLSSGLILLLPTLALIMGWIAGIQWSTSTGVRVDVLFVVVTLSTAITVAVFWIAKSIKSAKPYTKPLNLAMIFGQMIDGLTTYISIYDPFHMDIPLYGEKHPVSLKLMEVSGGILFPIAKFFLIILIIYVIDVLYKEDLKQYVNFVNLLKICIFILGVAPGVRDVLRVTLGV